MQFSRLGFYASSAKKPKKKISKPWTWGKQLGGLGVFWWNENRISNIEVDACPAEKKKTVQRSSKELPKKYPKHKRFGYEIHPNVFFYPSTSWTLSAASLNSTTEITSRPLSSMSSLASTALVPCNLTMMGTWIASPIFL